MSAGLISARQPKIHLLVKAKIHMLKICKQTSCKNKEFAHIAVFATDYDRSEAWLFIKLVDRKLTDFE